MQTITEFRNGITLKFKVDTARGFMNRTYAPLLKGPLPPDKGVTTRIP